MGTELTARALSKDTKTYVYHFDHVGTMSLADIFGRGPLDMAVLILSRALGLHTTLGAGTAHADDLLYLFKQLLPIGPDGEKDKAMSRLLVDLWANFATYHDPTPKDPKGVSFVGDALQHLEKPWSPSRPKEDELLDYVILKDGSIIIEEDKGFSRRMNFLMKDLLPRLRFV